LKDEKKEWGKEFVFHIKKSTKRNRYTTDLSVDKKELKTMLKKWVGEKGDKRVESLLRVIERNGKKRPLSKIHPLKFIYGRKKGREGHIKKYGKENPDQKNVRQKGIKTGMKGVRWAWKRKRRERKKKQQKVLPSQKKPSVGGACKRLGGVYKKKGVLGSTKTLGRKGDAKKPCRGS